MALIVQKFGGSSVKDAEHIRNVARIITDTYRANNDVVVVLSAQGDTTDELIEKAHEINESPSRREMDMLLSTGEQASVALCAMAIEKLGCPVISLNAWQAGISTDSNYSNASIKTINDERLRAELDRRNIVIVTGFQGINRRYDITTLGRGGSDTSAVALAARIRADLCQIYTDVDGVYTGDPRIVPEARKLDEITFDEMLELASAGAQVLHNRSVEIAKRFGIQLEVLSSLDPKPGTIVKEVAKKLESTAISGVARDENVACIAITHLEDKPGVAYRIFSLLAQRKINVDIILQSIGRDNTKDITFTVAKGYADEAIEELMEHKDELNFADISCDTNVAKISIVGSGMINHPGIASQLFEALYNVGINIRMISTSEIKVSVLIDAKDSDMAIRAVHHKFFGERAGA